MIIKNTKIYGFDDSLVASGYPMMVGDVLDSKEKIITGRDKNRMIKLGNSPSGSGHGNALKGILVQFDIKYSQYWSLQAERYNWMEIVSSQSKMHRLVKMNISDNCNKYVDQRVIDTLNHWVIKYNTFEEKNIDGFISSWGKSLNKQDVFMMCLSNCPMGFEMWMKMSTNYLQLKTVYNQRKNHRTDDWKIFCSWCESLRGFVEICLNGERKFTDKNGKILDDRYEWKESE